jgi:hypothetical protein
MAERGSLCAEHAQRLSGVEDADVAEGAEDKQVLIAGDDKWGACGERGGEHEIIVGIAADGLR